MKINNVNSPLRYPGGKSRFTSFIANIMENNNIAGGHYLEPYAGGAGVAINLLLNGYASHIHINDADPAINAFWLSVTKHTCELLELLDKTSISIDEWFKWRSILKKEVDATIVETGFATLFMNRANRSGILKAGVIGGYAQSGKYKIDARFNKETIKQKILNIARMKNCISVYCEDSLSLLKRCHEFLPLKSIIYLDPPYYVKGKGLYRNYYNHNDHALIADILQHDSFKYPWVVSYDNVKAIRDMYMLSTSLEYKLSYSAQNRYYGDEIMFFSKDLLMPSTNTLRTIVD